MTSEILEKIRAAEKEAASLKSGAQTEARRLKAEAEADGKKLCEDAAAAGSRMRERMIAETAAKSDAATREMRAGASDEIKALAEAAGKRTDQAAAYIAREIMAKCQ